MSEIREEIEALTAHKTAVMEEVWALEKEIRVKLGKAFIEGMTKEEEESMLTLTDKRTDLIAEIADIQQDIDILENIESAD